MPDIKLATADVAAMKLGTTNVAKVMLGTVEVWPGAGPCTDVLMEPFANLTAWTNLFGSVTINATGGRGGGPAAVCNGASRADYAIPDVDESDVVTIGFAWRTTTLVAGNLDIIQLRSDAAATDHTRLVVFSDGHFTITRGSTSLAASATGLVAAATYYYLECRCKLADAPNGYVIVRLNGTEIINATGLDTRNAGTKTVYDTLRILGVASTANRFDDLYLSTGSGCGFKGDITIP